VESFLLERLGIVVAFGVILGIAIRIFSLILHRLWNIETSSRETALLIGGNIFILTFLLGRQEPLIIFGTSGLIVAGFFVNKLVMRRLDSVLRRKETEKENSQKLDHC
jgi:hypothetical protein